MNAPVPLIPDNAPFTPEQRAWLNGFMAGVFSRAAGSQPATALAPLTILFGSQTGTAEGLARKAAKEAGKRGFAPTVLDLAQTDLAKLAGEKNVLVITSTYGDGEPPDNAKTLHAALKSAAQLPTSKAQLSTLRYSVCALGDTNYAQFCQCGKDLDAWFEKLGATRITPRTDCDLDYEAAFIAWLDAALSALGSAVGGALRPDVAHESGHKTPPTDTEPTYSKKNPFPATLLAVRNLNGVGSAKEVNHVEFSLESSGLVYEAGDALGVVPQNCPALVADVLAALGCDGEEAVPAGGSEMPLRRALTEHYCLGKPSADLIALLGGGLSPDSSAASGHKAPPTLASTHHHVIDVLLAAAIKPSPIDFVARLKKIQPRLYSISSSPKAHPGQVHLTVGAVRYDKDGRARKGVCSTCATTRTAARAKGCAPPSSPSAPSPPARSACSSMPTPLSARRPMATFR
jgi:sulfite reductase (NADPH) flavoprotein alpha-component